MIEQVLSYICLDINAFLKRKHSLSEDVVTLSNIDAADSSLARSEQSQIIMTLVNISEETTLKTLNPRQDATSHSITSSPPVYINCSVLFSAHYSGKNYPSGLKMISDVISFYQNNRFYSKQNAPGLGLDKLTLELVKLNLEDLNNLWSSIGTKHVPSVLLKIGLIPFNNENQITTRENISSIK